MENRESGFYWVRISDRWRVAKWYSILCYWEIVGSAFPLNEMHLDQIDERKIENPNL